MFDLTKDLKKVLYCLFFLFYPENSHPAMCNGRMSTTCGQRDGTASSETQHTPLSVPLTVPYVADYRYTCAL